MAWMVSAPRVHRILLLSAWLCVTLPAPALASGEHLVALTFDDLPFVNNGNENPDRYRQRMGTLSRYLKANAIPAVGFVNELRLYRGGKLDRAAKGVLEEWLDNGLELGNHTYSHSSLHVLPPSRFEAEVIDGEKITRQLVAQRGARLKYFRPPYLHVGLTPEMRHDAEALLKRLGYQVAPVTININDWSFAAAYEKLLAKDKSPQRERLLQAYLAHISESLAYAERLSRELFGRSIRHVAGLHANSLNTDNIDAIAKHMRRQGFRFISLDEALRDEAYTSLDTYHGPRGESWLYHWAVSVGLHPIDEPKVPDFVKRLAGPSAYQK